MPTNWWNPFPKNSLRVVQNRGKERKRKEKKGKEKEREEGEKGNFLFISMNFFALVYFFFVGCRAEATGPAWKPLFLRCKKVKAEDPKKRGVDSLKGGSTQARIQVWRLSLAVTTISDSGVILSIFLGCLLESKLTIQQPSDLLWVVTFSHSGNSVVTLAKDCRWDFQPSSCLKWDFQTPKVWHLRFSISFENNITVSFYQPMNDSSPPNLGSIKDLKWRSTQVIMRQLNVNPTELVRLNSRRSWN